MSQPSDDRSYEVAHLVARFAGEEGPEHPRQRAVRWLETNDLGAEVAKFNQSYARGHGGKLYKTLVAFRDALRRAGYGSAETQRVLHDVLHVALHTTFSASRPIEVISP